MTTQGKGQPTQAAPEPDRLTIRLGDDLRARLDAAALSAMRNRADYARIAILEKLERDGF